MLSANLTPHPPESSLDHGLRQVLSHVDLGLFSRGLMHDSPNPICIADGNGTIAFANPAFCHLHQVDRDEVEGRDLISIWPKEKRSDMTQALATLTPLQPCRRNISIGFGRNGTGHSTWVKYNMRALFDESGSPSCYQIQGQDVTVSEEVDRLNDSMEVILNNSPVGFVYSENLTIKRVCPHLCRMIGYAEEELVGQQLPCWDFYCGLDQDTRLKATGDLENASSSSRETCLKHRDGHPIDVRILTVPLKLDAATRRHFFFIEDITARKELERQQIRTETVVSRSSLVLFQAKWEKGLPLTYLSENVNLFGYLASELVADATRLVSLVHPEDLPETLGLMKDSNRAGSMEREYTYRLRTGEGGYRWVNQKCRIIPAEGNTPSMVVGFIMDVTDEKRTREELHKTHWALRERVFQLENAWEDTVNLLAAVTELRDPYTMGHQKRVAHLSRAIAREMGWDEKRTSEVVHAAIIHDIGKIQIPTDFLSKPGKLSDKEYGFIKDHAQVGADLIAKVSLPWNVSKIVEQHHERLDGSGYPKGLKGDEILPAARVIAVADVVEAMASHRPYRPALGIDAALKEITSNSGRLYDPQAVAACRRLFREKDYRWPEA